MTENSIKGSIHTSMVAAMRAQDKARLGIIRLIQAGIKQQEVDERITLTDEQVLTLLDKMIRQRRESIKQFEMAKREDLVQQESFEVLVIQEFLPQPLTSEEITTLIQHVIEETGAASIRDMGKVMTLLRPKILGRADLNEVGTLIKIQLTS